MISIKRMNKSNKLIKLYHNNPIPIPLWLKSPKDNDGSMPRKFIQLKYKVLDRFDRKANVRINSIERDEINKLNIFHIQCIYVTVDRDYRRHTINGRSNRKRPKTLQELAHGH